LTVRPVSRARSATLDGLARKSVSRTRLVFSFLWTLGIGNGMYG
jgi:hypothetical protein